MADKADERSKVDRTEGGGDPSEDVREEYTTYRPDDSGKPGREDESAGDAEARREADLQPGPPEEKKRD